jgi:large subunit ribosomal protein L13
MRTTSAKASEISRRWLVIDATDQPVGRLASRVASVLRGKHKPDFTTHADAGDFVVVVNADKAKLTGTKPTTKFYYRHSGFPGGVRTERAGELLATRPDYVIERAVKGMLPKTSLGRQMFRKLKIYSGGTHPHSAQKPEPFPA